MQTFDVETPVGTARVDLDLIADARGLLLLGHGAGGTVESADLLAVRLACLDAGIAVARVTQPYRVAGRKAPPAAAILDSGWRSVVQALGARQDLVGLPVVYAGRSSGARVACRTAAEVDLLPRAVAVIALAFPVHPPGKPERSRLDELDGVPVPVLVVQGRSDPFGMPPPAAGREVAQVAGNHSLSASTAELGPIVAGWLTAQLSRAGGENAGRSASGVRESRP